MIDWGQVDWEAADVGGAGLAEGARAIDCWLQANERQESAGRSFGPAGIPLNAPGPPHNPMGPPLARLWLMWPPPLNLQAVVAGSAVVGGRLGGWGQYGLSAPQRGPSSLERRLQRYHLGNVPLVLRLAVLLQSVV